MAMELTLEQMAGMAPGVSTTEVMQSIAEDLAQPCPVAARNLPEPPRLHCGNACWPSWLPGAPGGLPNDQGVHIAVLV